MTTRPIGTGVAGIVIQIAGFLLSAPALAGTTWEGLFINKLDVLIVVTKNGHDCWYPEELDKLTVIVPGESKHLVSKTQNSGPCNDFPVGNIFYTQGFVITPNTTTGVHRTAGTMTINWKGKSNFDGHYWCQLKIADLNPDYPAPAQKICDPASGTMKYFVSAGRNSSGKIQYTMGWIGNPK